MSFSATIKVRLCNPASIGNSELEGQRTFNSIAEEIASKIAHAYEFNSDNGWSWLDQGTAESYGDASGHLRSDANKIDLVNFSGAERTNVRRSWNLNASQDFIIDFEFRFLSAISSSAAYAMVGISDTDFSSSGDPIATGNSCFLSCGKGTSAAVLTLQSIKNGTGSSANLSGTHSANVTYYARLRRVGTTLTGTTYSDSDRTSQVGTASITNCCVAAATILYAMLARTDLSSRDSTMWIDNVTIYAPSLTTQAPSGVWDTFPAGTAIDMSTIRIPENMNSGDSGDVKYKYAVNNGSLGSAMTQAQLQAESAPTISHSNSIQIVPQLTSSGSKTTCQAFALVDVIFPSGGSFMSRGVLTGGRL